MKSTHPSIQVSNKQISLGFLFNQTHKPNKLSQLFYSTKQTNKHSNKQTGNGPERFRLHSIQTESEFACEEEGGGRGARDTVKAKSPGEDSQATGGLVSNLPHFQINKRKQHTNKERNKQKFKVRVSRS